MDGVSVLGSSGQNVDDVYKYSVGEDRLDIMHRMLQWGHFVPTAPDTLTSYPYSDSDPFIIEHTPHVLFAGNQPAFATRMVTGKPLYSAMPGLNCMQCSDPVQYHVTRLKHCKLWHACYAQMVRLSVLPWVSCRAGRAEGAPGLCAQVCHNRRAGADQPGYPGRAAHPL